MNVVNRCNTYFAFKFLKKGLVMKIKLLIVTIAFLLSIPAFAAKPSWAGKGKSNQEEHKQDNINTMHETKEKKAMKDKVKKEKKHKEEKVKKEKKDMMKEGSMDEGVVDEDVKKGLEKQKVKKAGQEQKELGKGSEQGQESRGKRKKWYKFWE